MGIIDRLDNRRYCVAITFKAGRNPVECVMQIGDYRQMVNDYRKGKTTGTYPMILDGTNAELTFPLQEIDTIHCAPEVTE